MATTIFSRHFHNYLFLLLFDLHSVFFFSKPVPYKSITFIIILPKVHLWDGDCWARPLCKVGQFSISSVGAHQILCALCEDFICRIHLIHTSRTAHRCLCTRLQSVAHARPRCASIFSNARLACASTFALHAWRLWRGQWKILLKNTCLTNTIFSNPTKIRLTITPTAPIYETTQHKQRSSSGCCQHACQHQSPPSMWLRPPPSSNQNRNNTYIRIDAGRWLVLTSVLPTAQTMPK